MQIQMQVFAKRRGGSTTSLRTRVIRDLRDRGYDPLYLVRAKDVERKPGWAKVKANGINGAINIEWHPDSAFLSVRAICRGKGNVPHIILGHFVAYLLERHRPRIGMINMQLT